MGEDAEQLRIQMMEQRVAEGKVKPHEVDIPDFDIDDPESTEAWVKAYITKPFDHWEQATRKDTPHNIKPLSPGEALQKAQQEVLLGAQTARTAPSEQRNEIKNAMVKMARSQAQRNPTSQQTSSPAARKT